MSRASSFTYDYVKLRVRAARLNTSRHSRQSIGAGNLEDAAAASSESELTFAADAEHTSSAALPPDADADDDDDADDEPSPSYEVQVLRDSRAPPAAGQRTRYDSIALRVAAGADVVTTAVPPIGDAPVGAPTAASRASATNASFKNGVGSGLAAPPQPSPARTLSGRLRPYWQEVRWLGLYAVPLTLTYFLLFLPLPIVSHFALQLESRDERRAVNLTHGLFGLFVLAYMYGIINTGNCLFAQAFGSADVALMRTHFQRILLTSLVLFLLVPAPLLLLVQGVVSALDGAEVAANSDLFLLILTPGVFGALLFGVVMQLFQAQNLLVNNLAAASLANLSLLGTAFALVEWLRCGIAGLAASLTVCYLVLGAVSALLAAKEGLPRLDVGGSDELSSPVAQLQPQKGLFAFDRHALAGWSLYIRISLSNAALGLFQSLPFYTAGIVAKGLTEAEARAQEVLIRVVEFYQEVPEGVSSLCTTRIANHVGGRQPASARHTAVVTLLVHVLFIAFANAVILVFRRTALGFIARGKDLSLVEDMTLFQYVMLLGSLFILYNAGLAILNAVGIFTVPAIVTVLIVVLFILPLELVLTYLTPLRVHGVWIAFAAGAGLLALYSNASALRIRWLELSTEKLVQNKTDDNIAEWHAAELLARGLPIPLPLCGAGANAGDATDDDEAGRPLVHDNSPARRPPEATAEEATAEEATAEEEEELYGESGERLIRKRLVLLGVIVFVILNTFIVRFIFRIVILKYI